MLKKLISFRNVKVAINNEKGKEGQKQRMHVNFALTNLCQLHSYQNDTLM